MRLVPDPDPENVRIARLDGNIALRCAYVPYVDGCNIFDVLGVSSVPRVFQHTDLALKCVIASYVLAESKRDLADFVPAEVEVRGLGEPICFWPGSALALMVQEEDLVRKKTSKKTGPRSICQCPWNP